MFTIDWENWEHVLMSTHTQNPNDFSELNKNVSSHNICSCNQPAPILEHSESATNESNLPSQLDIRPNVVYLPVVKWNLKLQSNPNFPSGSFCTKVFQLDKKLNSISQRLKASAEEVERLATYTGKFFITNYTGNIVNSLSAKSRKWRPWRLLNVLCAINLRPVSTEISPWSFRRLSSQRIGSMKCGRMWSLKCLCMIMRRGEAGFAMR